MGTRAFVSRRRRRRRTLAIAPARRVQAEINVTPLIDVVLVLLITFMVLTPMVERELGVQLAAERHVQERSERTPSQVLVAVEGHGVLRINAQAIEPAQYVAHLRRLLGGRAPEDRVVFVVASDETDYASLVEAIERAKEAGAAAIGLATDAAP